VNDYYFYFNVVNIVNIARVSLYDSLYHGSASNGVLRVFVARGNDLANDMDIMTLDFRLLQQFNSLENWGLKVSCSVESRTHDQLTLMYFTIGLFYFSKISPKNQYSIITTLFRTHSNIITFPIYLSLSLLSFDNFCLICDDTDSIKKNFKFIFFSLLVYMTFSSIR